MLPLGGSTSRRDNGIRNIPTVNKYVAVSAGGLLLAILMFFAGIYHCRSYAYNYSLRCGAAACTFSHTDSSNTHTPFEYVVDREKIKSAASVRIDNSNGNIIENIKAHGRIHLGYNVKVVLMEAVPGSLKMEVEKIVTFSPYNLGRRLSRSSWNQLQNYIDKKSSSVKINSGKSVTLFGILMIVFSLAIGVVVALFGQWSDVSPASRRMKKAS